MFCPGSKQDNKALIVIINRPIIDGIQMPADGRIEQFFLRPPPLVLLSFSFSPRL